MGMNDLPEMYAQSLRVQLKDCVHTIHKCDQNADSLS